MNCTVKIPRTSSTYKPILRMSNARSRVSSLTENCFIAPALTKNRAGEINFTSPCFDKRMIFSTIAGFKTGDSISVYFCADSAPSWVSCCNFLPDRNEKSDCIKNHVPSDRAKPLANFLCSMDDSSFVNRALVMLTIEPCLTMSRSMMIFEI